MTAENVGNLHLILGLITFGAVAWIFVWPRLKAAALKDALAALLLFSAFRYTALQFVNPAVAPNLAPGFAVPATIGDVSVGLLALAAAIVVRFHGFGVILAWLYAIAGSADFVYAASQATVHKAADGIGAAWPVFNLGGPAWMVTLVLLFMTLIKNKNK